MKFVILFTQKRKINLQPTFLCCCCCCGGGGCYLLLLLLLLLLFHFALIANQKQVYSSTKYFSVEKISTDSNCWGVSLAQTRANGCASLIAQVPNQLLKLSNLECGQYFGG